MDGLAEYHESILCKATRENAPISLRGRYEICVVLFNWRLLHVAGYYTADGILEMHPLYVMRNYAQTWFPFDLAATTCDWVFILFKPASSGAFRLARHLLRALRTIRILRLGCLVLRWISDLYFFGPPETNVCPISYSLIFSISLDTLMVQMPTVPLDFTKVV